MSEEEFSKSSSSLEKSSDSSRKGSGLSKVVNLNVGEYVFSTTIGTLTKYDTKLKNIISDHQEHGAHGKGKWIRINRHGRYFNKILNFLRDGSVPLPETREELTGLLEEAEFYRMEDLINLIKSQLSNMEEKSKLDTLPKIFFHASSGAVEFLNQSTRPEIRLTIESASVSVMFQSCEEFSAIFDTFNTICEIWSHEFVFNKHYVITRKIGPTCEWSFFVNGQNFGTIDGNNRDDLLRMINDFIRSFHVSSRKHYGADISIALSIFQESTKAIEPCVIEPDDRSSLNEGDPRELVKLNVGGLIFHLTRRCLTKYESMLDAMFSGRYEDSVDSEGCIRIDRSGDNFVMIRDFLRDDKLLLPKSREKLYELLAEAEFYQLKELIILIKEKLSSIERSVAKSPCKIFIIKSIEDENLWKMSTAPSVKLKIQNNPQNPIEVLWKHIILLERFCCINEGKIRFAQQITNECTCLWTFSIGGGIVAQYQYYQASWGSYRFDDNEIYESMIKFLMRIQQ